MTYNRLHETFVFLRYNIFTKIFAPVCCYDKFHSLGRLSTRYWNLAVVIYAYSGGDGQLYTTFWTYKECTYKLGTVNIRNTYYVNSTYTVQICIRLNAMDVMDMCYSTLSAEYGRDCCRELP